MALSHSPRSDCEKERTTQIKWYHSVWKSVHSTVNSRESYWDVLGQPLRDVQVVNLDGDFLAVAWFGHSDGSQVLQTQQDKTVKTFAIRCKSFKGVYSKDT